MTEQRFPCDTCGSDLEFDPNTHQMVCDYCGNSQEIEGLTQHRHSIREIDLLSALKGQPEAEYEETRVVDCTNCGASVEYNEATHSDLCPFCATPVVTDTGTHRHIKPQAVMPFILPEKAAKSRMTDWLGALWFAPNGLKDYARKGRKMSGIYVPFWTYDAQTRSRYSGQQGTIYYENRRVIRNGQSETVRVQKVRWRNASGRVQRFFDDVLVLASRALPKSYTDALAPWDLSALTPYTPEILAGFRAEGYTIALEDGLDEARARMDAIIERDVRFDIGGDRQRIHDIDTDISDLTFKHVLLPVWVAAYKYRGKTYRFVVNGQTGRVEGERPYSAWKIAFALVAGLILAGIIAFVMAQQ